MTTSPDRRTLSPSRVIGIKRMHALGHNAQQIGEYYGVSGSTILQFVDHHGLDTDYVRLSDLSRELNLDRKTLSAIANRGRIAQARKRGNYWMVHKSDVSTVLARFSHARTADPTGLLSTEAVAHLFKVGRSTVATRYFYEAWLSPIRRFKVGDAWFWNPGDTLEQLKKFREKDFLKKRVLEYLKLEGSGTTVEIASALKVTPHSIRAVLKKAHIAGLVQQSVYSTRMWEPTREALE